MLILTRKVGEAILFADSTIEVRVLGIDKGQVRLGTSAPYGVSINREEVQLRIDKEKRDAA